MASQGNKDLLREIATLSSDPGFVAGLVILPNPDEVFRKAGITDEVFKQVLTDSHVISKVIDRRSGLLRHEWEVQAAGNEAREQKAAELCNLALGRMEDHELFPLENSLGLLQDAALRGYRGLEVLWESTPDGILPAYLRDIPNRRLKHSGSEWRLLTRDEPSEGIVIPEKKLLLASHMATSENPYGEALLSRCYWPYMFKHNGVRWWVTLAEKYGLPWIIGKLGAAAEEAARRDLLNKLVAMVMDAIAVIPQNAELEFHNQSGVNSEVHERLIRQCNAEISKVLVGQTLSTELDQEGGSRAAAETHSGLRAEIVEADRKLVARVMSRLLAWITELNLGPDVMPPRFAWIDEDRPPTEWAAVVKTATEAMPGRVPERWAYDKLGIGEEYRGEDEVMLPAGSTMGQLAHPGAEESNA